MIQSTIPVTYSEPTGYFSLADVVEVVNGIITKIYQVGKVNQNGTPIAREIRAIEDIMQSADYNGAPIFFIPYNMDIGEIIYLE